MAIKIDNRRDILLLMLYSPGSAGANNEPIVGRTRLVKMLFLFKEEALQHFQKNIGVNNSNFYEFFAWNFGPFSQQVYDDVTFFMLRGFIASSEAEEETLPESAEEWERWISSAGVETGADDEFVEEKFELTEKGMKFTMPMFESLTGSQKDLLREFKTRTAAAPLRALLRYVYDKYPRMIEKSTIKDQILG